MQSHGKLRNVHTGWEVEEAMAGGTNPLANIPCICQGRAETDNAQVRLQLAAHEAHARRDHLHSSDIIIACIMRLKALKISHFHNSSVNLRQRQREAIKIGASLATLTVSQF